MEVGRRREIEKKACGYSRLFCVPKTERKSLNKPQGPCTEGLASFGSNLSSVNRGPPGRVEFLRSFMAPGSKKEDEGGRLHTARAKIVCATLMQSCRGKKCVWQHFLPTKTKK